MTEGPALFLPISREKWGPPPGRRGNGALRPKVGKSPAHPKGTQYHPPPTRDWKTTPPCGMMETILL